MRAIDVEISTEEAAELIGRTPRRVQQMRSEGLISSSGRGRYVLSEVVRAHMVVLQRERDAVSAKGTNSHIQALRAQEIEVRIEERKGRLAATAMAESLAAVDQIAGGLKSDLLSIPARVTGDLGLRRRLEDEINEAFGRAAERADAFGSGHEAAGVPVEAPTKAPARRVGKAKPKLSAQRRKARPA